MNDRAPDDLEADRFKPWRAVADLYHAYFTGLIMLLVARRSEADAVEFVFRVFRRQHHERFLAGIEKFGLKNAPHAVAAAQYHYLSNHIGGVNVEYMRESDRKAWIRYPPPRWIWRGTAICAIPSEVSAAMLRGWHAHNGVSFNNPRLGFVCTKQTVDGQNGLEGFYYEYDRDLRPEERLIFARHLDAPLFDATRAPKLATDTWPRSRLEKAYRNYAMEYTRSGLPVMVQLFGSKDAGELMLLTGKLIGMQLYPDVAAGFRASDRDGPSRFADFLLQMLQAQGDDADVVNLGDRIVVSHSRWNLLAGVKDSHPSCLLALKGLIEGLMATHDPRLSLEMTYDTSKTDGPIRWIIAMQNSPLAADNTYPA